MSPAVERDRNRLHATEIAPAAPAILRGVAVQERTPETTPGSVKTIVLAGNGSEIADDEYDIFRGGSFPNETNDTGFAVITIDPFEPRRIQILLVQRGFAPIEPIQFRNPPLGAVMPVVFGLIPVQTPIMRPFRPLTEFANHEQQLLRWLGKHVSEEEAQVGEFLPIISRHLAQKRPFTIDHFVV